MEIEHKSIDVEPTFKTKHFRNYVNACNPYMYKTPNLQKTIVVAHHFFVQVCGTKNPIIAYLEILVFFSKWLLSMSNNMFYHFTKLFHYYKSGV